MSALQRVKRDDGIAAVELGLILPLLLLLLTAVVPIVKASWEYMGASRAVAHGIRYASRVDVNARTSASGLTRRPSPAEVEQFVRDAASPLDLSSVEVSPAPNERMPGDVITVRASYVVSYGPLAAIANTVSEDLFGKGPLLPDNKEITVSARGREE